MEKLNIVTTQQEVVQEEPYKSGSVHYIDSRDVAEMVEKKHCDLMRDIRRYIAQMGKRNIAFSDFFIESSYRVEGQGKIYPCFMVTEKGCEFIAHKMTSEKGTAFTVAYIDRFHEMKGELEGQMEPALQEFLNQQAKFNQMVLERFEKMENQSVGIFSRNPFSVQQDVIDQRMRTLNDLTNQVADLCHMVRKKVLHYLYKTLQEDLGVTLNPYLVVMKSEGGDENICNLHVIASIDRFYEKAVEMNRDVIDRKNLFG